MSNVETDPTDPGVATGNNRKKGKPRDGEPSTSTRVLNLPAVLAILFVMAALVIIVFKVVDSYDRGSDAIGVLGVIIPMFATVGAAVFGIPVAYERGAAKAEEKAAQTTEKKVRDAQKNGEQNAKAKLEPNVRALDAAVNRLAEQVEMGMESPAGQDAFVVKLDRHIADQLPEGARSEEPMFSLPSQDIRRVRDEIGEMRASVESLGS